MSKQPFSAEVRGKILYIGLDTPGCAVNIFSHQAAVQLLEILHHIDPQVGAVVLFSAKPESFVNGVGLMLASAVAKPEDVLRLTATIRAAYRALEELKVPTIAAIRGNCYGCGVELSLRCRYRVAADSYDTHFYMTEVADYLFIPTFGGTQNLPRLLGLANATDFLLWGQRWSAGDALSRGLVDGRFPDDAFDDTVEQIATELARDGQSSRLIRTAPPATDVAAFGRQTRNRISMLPPAYQGVYSACYELLERATLKEKPEEADYEAEMLAAGRSVMAPISKAALSFFFVRQISQHSCLRDAREKTSYSVHCDASEAASIFLYAELERRRVRGVKVLDGAAESAEMASALHLVPYAATPVTPSADAAVRSVAICNGVELAPPVWNADAILYAPFWRRGMLFAEVACRNVCENAQSLFGLLTKAGIASIITRPKTTFLTNDLLRAYLAPQVSFLVGGGAPRDLAMTLLDFGFTRLPGDWLERGDAERLTTLVVGAPDGGGSGWRTCFTAATELPKTRDFEGGQVSTSLASALLASLLAFAFRNLQTGGASHPSIVDVAAREIVDFPVGQASLCRYLTVSRARELLRQESAFSILLSPDVLATVKEFTHNGRDFYR